MLGCFGAIRAPAAGLSEQQLAAASRLCKKSAQTDAAEMCTIGTLTSKDSIPLGTELDPVNGSLQLIARLERISVYEYNGQVPGPAQRRQGFARHLRSVPRRGAAAPGGRVCGIVICGSPLPDVRRCLDLRADIAGGFLSVVTPRTAEAVEVPLKSEVRRNFGTLGPRYVPASSVKPLYEFGKLRRSSFQQVAAPNILIALECMLPRAHAVPACWGPPTTLRR